MTSIYSFLVTEPYNDFFVPEFRFNKHWRMWHADLYASKPRTGLSNVKVVSLAPFV